MKSPFIIKSSISASGSHNQAGDIPLVRARTLSITARCTFNASGTSDATVYIYYSPDGNNWDTIAYTSFNLTVDAGNAVQRTLPIDTPEHGYIKIKITNGDSTYTITNIKAWYSIQSFFFPGEGKGKITADSGEES